MKPDEVKFVRIDKTTNMGMPPMPSVAEFATMAQVLDDIQNRIVANVTVYKVSGVVNFVERPRVVEAIAALQAGTP